MHWTVNSIRHLSLLKPSKWPGIDYEPRIVVAMKGATYTELDDILVTCSHDVIVIMIKNPPHGFTINLLSPSLDDLDGQVLSFESVVSPDNFEGGFVAMRGDKSYPKPR